MPILLMAKDRLIWGAGWGESPSAPLCVRAELTPCPDSGRATEAGKGESYTAFLLRRIYLVLEVKPGRTSNAKKEQSH